MLKRYLSSFVETDALASQKMAFISGPRQCGKTTLARLILASHNQSNNYFNWDNDDFKREWIKGPSAIVKDLVVDNDIVPIIVLDEIHKTNKWKNSLKGLFDTYSDTLRIIVTGSAHFEFFRKSGDSLAGRYIPYHLHPFSLGETDHVKVPSEDIWQVVDTKQYPYEALFVLGGFPEPLLGGSEQKAQRWRRLYKETIIREEVRDLKSIRDIRLIDTLAALLPNKVGSPLSINSLREDLNVSFSSVADWLDLLETVYYCFRIKPYHKKLTRMLQKETKLYLYDWSFIPDPTLRLENLVASHLFKACQTWTDCAFGNFDLFYVRDKEKREVDFLVTRNEMPYLLAEVKSSDTSLAPSLAHYSALIKPKFSFQVVNKLNLHKAFLESHRTISLIDVRKFLSALP